MHPSSSALVTRIVGMALSFPQSCQDGLDDIGVRAAATQPSSHLLPDLVFGGMRVVSLQRHGRHDLPRCAEPTWVSVVGYERLLHRVEALATHKALDIAPAPSC